MDDEVSLSMKKKTFISYGQNEFQTFGRKII